MDWFGFLRGYVRWRFIGFLAGRKGTIFATARQFLNGTCNGIGRGEVAVYLLDSMIAIVQHASHDRDSVWAFLEKVGPRRNEVWEALSVHYRLLLNSPDRDPYKAHFASIERLFVEAASLAKSHHTPFDHAENRALVANLSCVLLGRTSHPECFPAWTPRGALERIDNPLARGIVWESLTPQERLQCAVAMLTPESRRMKEALTQLTHPTVQALIPSNRFEVEEAFVALATSDPIVVRSLQEEIRTGMHLFPDSYRMIAAGIRCFFRANRARGNWTRCALETADQLLETRERTFQLAAFEVFESGELPQYLPPLLAAVVSLGMMNPGRSRRPKLQRQVAERVLANINPGTIRDGITALHTNWDDTALVIDPAAQKSVYSMALLDPPEPRPN